MRNLAYAVLLTSLPADSFMLAVKPVGRRSTVHYSPGLLRDRRWRTIDRRFLVQRSHRSNDQDSDDTAPESDSSISRSLDVEVDGYSNPWWRKASALALLNVVTLVWGTQHAVIKVAIDSPAGSPAILTLARFGLAALLFAPWLPLPDMSQNNQELSSDALEGSSTGSVRELDRSSDPSAPTVNKVWLAGAELGLWMFAGYALQAVGLETTTASRSAFLLYLNVKLVPLFSAIFLGRKHPPSTWIAAAVALAGTGLLVCSDSTAPPTVGDAWSIAAAAASAGFILRLEGIAKSGADPKALTASSTATVALLAAVWALSSAVFHPHATLLDTSSSSSMEILYDSSSSDLVTSAMMPQPVFLGALSEVQHDLSALADDAGGAVVYLAIVATGLATWLQAVSQRYVGAEQAALVYALDPVWGAFFANYLLGETLSQPAAGGAALVATAALGSAALGLRKESPEKKGGVN